MTYYTDDSLFFDIRLSYFKESLLTFHANRKLLLGNLFFEKDLFLLHLSSGQNR